MTTKKEQAIALLAIAQDASRPTAERIAALVEAEAVKKAAKTSWTKLVGSEPTVSLDALEQQQRFEGSAEMPDVETLAGGETTDLVPLGGEGGGPVAEVETPDDDFSDADDERDDREMLRALADYPGGASTDLLAEDLEWDAEDARASLHRLEERTLVKRVDMGNHGTEGWALKTEGAVIAGMEKAAAAVEDPKAKQAIKQAIKQADRGSIGQMVKELLRQKDEEMSYEDIVEAVKAEFPDAKTTARSVASVAADMRRAGEDVPTRRGKK